ncbi:MAG: T9SS type A sorting domain-containing protein [Flavobacteriales bacterium]|jgi:hypothetical protein|tara:strand:- start:3151 stop:4041 length:891 start_codon:yes stop_codon:yes gene_type:complete
MILNNKISIFILVLISSLSVQAQNLEWRGLTLQAHYELLEDGIDKTGNYGTAIYGNHKFEDGGILSKGCRLNDTCLISSPQIDALNDPAFAIQVEFKANAFGSSIIMAGRSYRYLGMGTNSSGNFTVKTGSLIENTFFDVTLELDKWYLCTAIHNTQDSISEFWLDGKLLGTWKQFLNHPANDNAVANIDYSRGWAFDGHLKNLKVYSTNNLVSTEKLDLLNNFQVSPNPATNTLNVNLPMTEQVSYAIVDMKGVVISDGELLDQSIDISGLQPAIYYLRITNGDNSTGVKKFIKL